MKLVFMGTPEFAAKSLSALSRAGHELLGVFTQPDKPKGRGQRLEPPPVKTLAESLSIPVFQPITLKDGAALETLKQLAPEIIVVAAYGKILPKAILELPKYGCINVHASLLPRLRGAAPANWSIINGDDTTGVTIMQMDVGLDTGDMFSQAEIPIGESETAGELLERLAELGADLLLKTLDDLAAGTAKRTPQEHSQATWAPMLDKELARLDFNKAPNELCNLIRGLNPAPCAFSRLEGKLLKVLAAAPIEGFSGEPGQILDAKRLIIGCKGGAVELLQVSPEGKRPMSGGDFLRGKRLAQPAYMETTPALTRHPSTGGE
jgi:methionyl-tRNA formyltransferase